jgi:hypothetical protein
MVFTHAIPLYISCEINELSNCFNYLTHLLSWYLKMEFYIFIC